MSELKRLFGARLKILRSINGLTQAELAEQTGVTKHHLGRIERGLSSPSFEALERLCEVLGTDPANMFLFPVQPDGDRDSNSPFSSLTLMSGWGAWSIDFETGEQRWSNALCRLLGCAAPKKPSLKKFLKRVCAEDERLFSAFHEAFVTNRVPAQTSCRVRGKDGQVRMLRVQADVSADRDGGGAVGLLSFQDITDELGIRKLMMMNHEQLETTIREKTLSLARSVESANREISRRADVERRLRIFEDIVHSAPDPVVFIDEDYVYQVANSGYGELFERPRLEILGKKVVDVVGQKLFAGAIKPLLDKALAGERVRFQRWIETGGDEQKFMDVSYSPHREAGAIVGVVAIMRDMTAQETIHDELRQYKNAVDSSLAAIAMTDSNGCLTKVNPAFLRLWGLSREQEAIGRHGSEFWAEPEEVLRIMEHLSELRPWEGRLQARNCSGEAFTAKVLASPLLGSEGELAGFSASFWDESVRIAAEGRLRESERRARALIDATTDAVALHTVDGVILDLNEEMARLFSKSKEQLVGASIWDQMPADVAARRKLNAQKVVAAGRPGRHLDQREGIWSDYVMYPLFDERGDVEHIAVFAHDATELLEAREALRESEAIRRAVLDAAVEAAFVTDLQTRIIEANAAALELFGRGLEELRGESVLGLAADGGGLSRLPDLDRMLAGDSGRLELAFQRTKGACFTAEVKVQACAGERLLVVVRPHECPVSITDSRGQDRAG